MMQLPQFLLSLVVTVGVCGLPCNGEQVVNDLWLQAVTNNSGKMRCFKLEPCSITYLRSHEVSLEKSKASTMYQLCLVPPDGTTVLPLEVLYFQNGNKSFTDCHHGRGNTDYTRFRISQNGSNEDIVFECNDGRIGRMLISVSFIKPPLIFTHLTGPVEEEGFRFQIDFSGDPRCTSPPPVNGGWSDWRCWSECTHSCGGGTRNRKRMCDSPKPEHGGEDCVGNVTANDQCNSQPCAVDGGLSEWSSWGDCSASCGNRTVSRERICDSPKPEFGGKVCEGELIDKQQCNDQDCNEPSVEKQKNWVAPVLCAVLGFVLAFLIGLCLCLRLCCKNCFVRLWRLEDLKIENAEMKNSNATMREVKPQQAQGNDTPPPNGEPPGADHMTESKASSSSTSDTNETAPFLSKQNHNEPSRAPAASDPASSTMQDSSNLIVNRSSTQTTQL